MSISVGKECSQCGHYYHLIREAENVVKCPHCGDETTIDVGFTEKLKGCPFCHSRQFYKRKDFNQVLGCSIVIIGAVLVPFTYGLSLPILIIIDWILYHRFPDVVVCYRCGAEYYGLVHIPEHVEGFDHHIGELYEK